MGGFWNDFFEIFGQNAQKAKNAQSAKKKTINIKDLPRKGIDPRFAGPPRVAGRRCSPPGGFNGIGNFGLKILRRSDVLFPLKLKVFFK